MSRIRFPLTLFVAMGLVAAACGTPADDSVPGASVDDAFATPLDLEPAGLEPVERSAIVVPLSVSDGQLRDGNGDPLQLRGVNRSGTEYACAQGWGIHENDAGLADGQAIDQMLDAMLEWGVNSVRVPLNEHCWLDRNGVSERFGGDAYHSAIIDLVGRIRSRGMVVMLALMWGDAGETIGLRQPPMANRDHSIDLWTSVASTFIDDGGVIFDLFGEPSIGESWSCWRDGCDFDGYPVAGMQSLVDAVRDTGATQPLIVSGLRFANDLSRWIEFQPHDPLDQVMAGFHLYNFNACVTVTCWEAEIAPVADQVPVITAELGEDSCLGDFVMGYLEWADQRDLSYLAWGFNEQDSCKRGPALIERHDGQPTTVGWFYRRHLIEAVRAE